MRFSVQDFPRYTSCLKQFAITALPSVVPIFVTVAVGWGKGPVTSQVVSNTDSPWRHQFKPQRWFEVNTWPLVFRDRNDEYAEFLGIKIYSLMESTERDVS